MAKSPGHRSGAKGLDAWFESASELVEMKIVAMAKATKPDLVCGRVETKGSVERCRARRFGVANWMSRFVQTAKQIPASVFGRALDRRLFQVWPETVGVGYLRFPRLF